MRRLLPFMARHRAHALPNEPAAVSGEPEGDLAPTAGPSVLVWLRGSDSDHWALITFDADAVIALLGGLFGSEPNDPPEGEEEAEEESPALGERLTLAQRALMRKVGRNFGEAFIELARARDMTGWTGVEIEARAADAPLELPGQGFGVICAVAEGPKPWRVLLFLSEASLDTEPAESAPAAAGASIEQAIVRVPVDVVAELGRIKMRLGQVLSLRRGDTLRLDSAASDPVLVRVSGVPKFRAVPVISRGQVSVKVQSRVEDT